MKRWLIGAAVFLCIAAAVFWMKRQFEIDQCLDRGGQWDYGVEMCRPSE